jgi:hypothetical protein
MKKLLLILLCSIISINIYSHSAKGVMRQDVFEKNAKKVVKSKPVQKTKKGVVKVSKSKPVQKTKKGVVKVANKLDKKLEKLRK